MKYLFKKYEFETQELAETRIAALPHQEVDGESHPSHSHTIVKLGNVVQVEVHTMRMVTSLLRLYLQTSILLTFYGEHQRLQKKQKLLYLTKMVT